MKTKIEYEVARQKKAGTYSGEDETIMKFKQLWRAKTYASMQNAWETQGRKFYARSRKNKRLYCMAYITTKYDITY